MLVPSKLLTCASALSCDMLVPKIYVKPGAENIPGGYLKLAGHC